MYFAVDLNDYLVFRVSKKAPNINFMISGKNDIKAYYEMNLLDKINDIKFLDNILIGPKCLASGNEIKMFMRQNDVFCNGILLRSHEISMR